MIHLIYIYIIINVFIIGFLAGEGSIDDLSLFGKILVIISGSFICVPTVIFALIYNYLKLCVDNSWIGNIRYVYRYRNGKEEVTPEAIEILNKSMDKKLAKPKKTFSDKIYIWGAKEINKTYLINQKSK
jgi:hypothetical protein